MNKTRTNKPWHQRIVFHGLSIQQRLPLLICVLLSMVILIFSLVSYYGVKKAAIEIGKNRLRSLTDELGTMFSQSSQALKTQMAATAKQEAVKIALSSGGIDSAKEALAVMNKLKRDSTWLLFELMDAHRVTLLSSGDAGVKRKLSVDNVFASLTPSGDSFSVGKTYAVGDSMYYPVVYVINEGRKAKGYFVSWRSLSNNRQTLAQLSQLMGAGATLYIGNMDGSLWTDLIKPVSAPSVNMLHPREFFEYKDKQGKKVIAAVQPISTTHWVVAVEFSEQTILETATRFLRWVIVAGAILTALGIFITWLMSRNIIRPLNQLTTAATAIAAGDYSPVKVTRLDELGKLANAFNDMSAQIKVTQQHLENKVRDRTMQLEASNKELEAFSYSISHDLRSPLRAIAGFTAMLQEQHGPKLDDEAKRLTEVITGNTLKMSNLIDDLLAFFRMSRHEMVKTKIPTSQLVHEVIAELDTKNKPINWVVQSLPESFGDINSIRQVWINLISNAIKYSRTVTLPQIEIGSKANNSEIIFFIKDNGVGFDIKYSDKLFKVFQRLHGANEFEGTGIGLAIVEKIVSKHGGRVWVEAEKNIGATFYFSLPIE
jgi:signal transduction histidine kinase